MESKNRGIQPQRALAPIHQSSNHSPTTVGFIGSEFGRSLVTAFQDCHQDPNPLPHLHPSSSNLASPQSYEIQEAIRREIEKSKIRHEMIVDDIVRRRMIESEVRRELMQRELGLSQGINGFSFSLPSAMGFDLPVRLSAMGSMAEARLIDERNMLPQRDKLHGSCESGWNDTLPFQRVSEVKSVPQGGKEKERIILLPKPDEVSGLKRKAAMPNPTEDMLRKRAKEEWSCALCQVSATSEQGLNDHLKGKKHKSKEAKLNAKAAKEHLGKSVRVEGSISPSTEDGQKSTSESLPPQKAEEASSDINDQGLLQKNICLDSPNKNHLTVVQTVLKSDDPKKAKFMFWCDICQVGTHSMRVMGCHRKGRKHLFWLRKSNQNSGADTFGQNEKILNHESDAEDNKNIVSDKVADASDETRSADHVATDTIIPEDHEAAGENEIKYCGEDADVSTKLDASNVSNDELTVC